MAEFPIESLWVSLLAFLAVALFTYGCADRWSSGTSDYWAWAWALLALNGALSEIGMVHVARVAATGIPVCHLLGVLRLRGTPLSYWILPATVAIAGLRGLLSILGAETGGALVSLALDPPLMSAGAFLLLRPAPEGSPASRVGAPLLWATAALLLSMGGIEALEALSRTGISVPHDPILSWLVIGVPLGTLQFTASLLALYRQASRSQEESSLATTRLADSEARLLGLLSSLEGTQVVVVDEQLKIHEFFGPSVLSSCPGKDGRPALRELLGDDVADEFQTAVREVLDSGRPNRLRRRVGHVGSDLCWKRASRRSRPKRMPNAPSRSSTM